MMVHFETGSGAETIYSLSATYLSSVGYDTLPPQNLQPGLLTIDFYSAPDAWKLLGYYRIETPGNPLNPERRLDDIVVQVPMLDGDGDGVPDFVEPERAIDLIQTDGVFENKGEIANLKATWQRTAGSGVGTCIMEFTGNSVVGDPYTAFIARYTNQFEITALAGTLKYATGASHSTGVVSIARTDAAYAFEGGSGQVTFTRSDTDHLQLADGSMPYYGGNLLQYTAATPFSRAGWIYRGMISITNGVMASLDPRYRNWLWRITDTNDRDQNGVPDFSDAAPPFPPLLLLQPQGDQMQVGLEGETGVSYAIQVSNDAANGPWSPAGSVAAPGGLLVARPAVSTTFWRAKFP
jgi:hypothetical protein